jgi:U4/U6 small nuclear ribonucleoprotein PRP4
VRLSLARPTLRQAKRRLAAERLMHNADGKAVFQASEAATVEAVRGCGILASQVGDTRPLSAISIGQCLGAQSPLVVATGSWGGRVKLWSGDSEAKLLQTLDVHTARISTVRLSKDHPGLLCVASADSTASLYIAKDACGKGEEMFKHKASLTGHTQRVSDFRVHPLISSLMVTASFDGTFILHSDVKPVLTQETGHTEGVYQAAFHPDGGLLATCGLAGGIRMWDVRSGRAVMTIPKAHIGAVTSLDFSVDGRTLSSAGGDNVLRIWDLRGRRCIRSIAAHSGLVCGAVFGGGGGDVIVSGSFDRSVKVWSARRGWAMLVAHTGHDDKVTAVDCSADARWIVSACYDKTWKLWGCEEGV